MSEAQPSAADWQCYRHPDREAGVRCSRCAKAICPDCMVTASVGFHCPDCVRRGGQQVRTLRSLPGPSKPFVTVTLLGVNVALFVLTILSGASLTDGGGDTFNELILYGPLVAVGDWWRLVTSGFLHIGLIHLGFNMALLYFLGQSLEPALGKARFATLYAVALLGGSLGILVAQPAVAAAGASGAVFGLMGASFVIMRRRGVDPMGTQVGPLLALNLVISFAVPGVAWGGHLGGLLAGAAAGWILSVTDGRDAGRRLVGTVSCLALGVGITWAALVVAASPLR